MQASVPNWTTAGHTMFTHSCLFMKPRGVARNHVTDAESNMCPKDSHQLILKGSDLLQCVQRSVVGFLHLCIHAAPKPLLVLCKCFFHVCTHTEHTGPVVSVTHTQSTPGQWSHSHTHSALGQWSQSHTVHWACGVNHTPTTHWSSGLSQTHTVHWVSGVSHTCPSLVFSSGAHCWCQSHTHACTQAHTHRDLSRLYSNSLQSAGPSGPTSQCEFRLHRTCLTM